MVDPSGAPQTARPAIPLVEALESDDRGAAFLEYMFSVLAPGSWWWHVDDGFEWIPHRLRHEVSIERLVDEEARTVRTFCRSVFTVVDGVEDVRHAMATANALNQRGLGGCAVFHFESGELRVVTRVELDPQSWFGAQIFEHVVTRLVGVLETAAARLAEQCNASPMVAVHPTRGVRDDPDQFIVETELLPGQPEAGAGMWWSKYEIDAFHDGLRYFVRQHDTAAAARIGSDVASDAPSADVFDLSLEMTSPVGDVLLSVHHAEHHEVGIGLEFLLSTKIAFEFSGDRDRSPANELWGALQAVNLVNLVECSSPMPTTVPLLAGGWSSWKGQVSLSTFLPAEVVRIMQQLAANAPPEVGSAPSHVGGMMAVLSFWHALRVNELRELLAFDGLEAEFETLDTYGWSGVSQNALRWSLLSDSAALIDRIALGRPMNELFGPVLLGRDAWMLPHQVVPFRMGIFNPMGPSVGTIELAIDYTTNRALLVERLRHPLAPSLRLHAVIDRDGFGRLGEFVGDVIAGLRWSLFDWALINAEFDEDYDPIVDGLRRFAERSDGDVASDAERLLDSQGNPWIRLDPDYEPRGVVPAGSSPDAYWIPLLLSPLNVDSHLAYLRSAWEGSRHAARADWDAAEEMTSRCIREISRRGSVHGKI